MIELVLKLWASSYHHVICLLTYSSLPAFQIHLLDAALIFCCGSVDYIPNTRVKH